MIHHHDTAASNPLIDSIWKIWYCTISWKKQVRKFPFNLPGKSEVTAAAAVAAAAFRTASFLLNQKGSSTQWTATSHCKLGNYLRPHSTYSLKTICAKHLSASWCLKERNRILLFFFHVLIFQIQPGMSGWDECFGFKPKCPRIHSRMDALNLLHKHGVVNQAVDCCAGVLCNCDSQHNKYIIFWSCDDIKRGRPHFPLPWSELW